LYSNNSKSLQFLNASSPIFFNCEPVKILVSFEPANACEPIDLIVSGNLRHHGLPLAIAAWLANACEPISVITKYLLEAGL
jgi:hypothetical protein